MLAKKLRLNRAQVADILEEGVTKKTKLFILRIQTNETAENKFATVISRKFTKKAVDRNKLKRRIHEAIRNNFSLLTAENGVYTVMIPKKPCLQKSYQEIEEEITYILPNLTKWANT